MTLREHRRERGRLYAEFAAVRGDPDKGLPAYNAYRAQADVVARLSGSEERRAAFIETLKSMRAGAAGGKGKP